jgi:hypothetical protein
MTGRFLRAFVLAVALPAGFLPFVVRAADDPAAALPAKHAAYVGWRVGDGSLKTLRETGEVTRDGKVIESLSRLQMGPIYRAAGSRAAGTLEGAHGQLDSLELGPISYRPVPACMSDSMAYSELMLGFDFLKNGPRGRRRERTR